MTAVVVLSPRPAKDVVTEVAQVALVSLDPRIGYARHVLEDRRASTEMVVELVMGVPVILPRYSAARLAQIIAKRALCQEHGVVNPSCVATGLSVTQDMDGMRGHARHAQATFPPTDSFALMAMSVLA
jgi:hypothetical protein